MCPTVGAAELFSKQHLEPLIKACEAAMRKLPSIVRDGVAITPVFGPRIAYASWLEACGLTSYETIRKDLAAVLDHGALSGVIL